MDNTSICIFGLGYIGLPTAAMFSAHGIMVRGIEVKYEVCDKINKGEIHIHEPLLADLVKQAVNRGLLSCGTELNPASDTAQVYIIAVPTPITQDKKADISHVKDAINKVGDVIKKGDLVIVESTVPPGCTMDILRPLLEVSGLKAGVDFYLAYCPERVLLGRVINELEQNNRIIGGINKISAEKAEELYSTFVKGEIHLTDIGTAEMCKLVENTYRDVNIALSNELAKLCETTNCDIWEVIRCANMHPRVNIHSPGPGVGGHCLAVDPWFLVQSDSHQGGIIEHARMINNNMPQHICDRAIEIISKDCKHNLDSKEIKIVILGCTYKANVDDMRESPIIIMAELLENRYNLNTNVNIVDPYIEIYKKEIYNICEGADIIILGVGHKEFETLDWSKISKVVRSKTIFDTRDFLDISILEGYGFIVHCLGRGKYQA
jgi:UDP-N-acetyl-D-mannosaminuronic acid dehydrogenase